MNNIYNDTNTWYYNLRLSNAQHQISHNKKISLFEEILKNIPTANLCSVRSVNRKFRDIFQERFKDYFKLHVHSISLKIFEEIFPDLGEQEFTLNEMVQFAILSESFLAQNPGTFFASLREIEENSSHPLYRFHLLTYCKDLPDRVFYTEKYLIHCALLITNKEEYEKAKSKIKEKTGKEPYFNARDILNNTPLMTAIINKNSFLIKALLDEKFLYLDAKSSYTPLGYAIADKDKATVIKLCEKGASLKKKYSSSEITPLHHATYSGELGIAKYFIEERKISLSLQVNQFSPLDLLMLHIGLKKSKAQHLPSIRYLLEKKASPYQESSKNNSSFIIACTMNDLMLTKLFYDNEKPTESYLSYSLREYINGLDRSPKPPNRDIVKFLIESKADPQASFLGENYSAMSVFLSSPVKEFDSLIDLFFQQKSNFLGPVYKAEDAPPVLVWSLRSNNIRFQKILKLAKIYIDSPILESEEETAYLIQIALKTNNIPKIKLLKEAKCQININSPISQNSSLHWATSSKNPDPKIIDFLIKEKANINSTNKRGQTPLMGACFSKNLEVINLLIENTADLNLKNNEGGTAIGFACVQNHSLDLVQLLIAKKANPNEKDNKGISPILFAAYSGNIPVFLDLLTKHKIPPDLLGKDGDSILHTICEKPEEDIKLFTIQISFLEENHMLKEMINHKNQKGITPFFYAALKGHFKIIKALIEKKADVNICDEDGMNVLFYAAERDDLSILKFLIEDQKINLSILDKFNRSPIYYAAQAGQCEALNYLREHIPQSQEHNTDLIDSKTSAVHIAAARGFLDIVKLLYEPGKEYVEDQHPLFWAAAGDHLNIVEYLIEKENRNKFLIQDTALVASEEGAMQVLCYLFDLEQEEQEKHVDTWQKECKVWNNERHQLETSSQKSFEIPFFGTKKMVSREMMKSLLLQTKPTLTSFASLAKYRNHEGYSCLHLAINNEHTNCVKFLLEKGADATVHDPEQDESCLDRALSGGNYSIARLLLEFFPSLLEKYTAPKNKLMELILEKCSFVYSLQKQDLEFYGHDYQILLNATLNELFQFIPTEDKALNSKISNKINSIVENFETILKNSKQPPQISERNINSSEQILLSKEIIQQKKINELYQKIKFLEQDLHGKDNLIKKQSERLKTVKSELKKAKKRENSRFQILLSQTENEQEAISKHPPFVLPNNSNNKELKKCIVENLEIILNLKITSDIRNKLKSLESDIQGIKKNREALENCLKKQGFEGHGQAGTSHETWSYQKNKDTFVNITTHHGENDPALVKKTLKAILAYLHIIYDKH